MSCREGSMETSRVLQWSRQKAQRLRWSWPRKAEMKETVQDTSMVKPEELGMDWLLALKERLVTQNGYKVPGLRRLELSQVWGTQGHKFRLDMLSLRCLWEYQEEMSKNHLDLFPIAKMRNKLPGYARHLPIVPPRAPHQSHCRTALPGAKRLTQRLGSHYGEV